MEHGKEQGKGAKTKPPTLFVPSTVLPPSRLAFIEVSYPRVEYGGGNQAAGWSIFRQENLLRRLVAQRNLEEEIASEERLIELAGSPSEVQVLLLESVRVTRAAAENELYRLSRELETWEQQWRGDWTDAAERARESVRNASYGEIEEGQSTGK